MPAIVQNQSASVEVLFAIARSDEEQCFYAWSPQLRCIRDGENEAEALAMCREAVEVLIESLLERGTLEAELGSLGYDIQRRPCAHNKSRFISYCTIIPPCAS